MPYIPSREKQATIPWVLMRRKNGLREMDKTKIVDFANAYHKRKTVMSNKLAYLAGLIDGEGYLKVEKHGTIRLIIGMTDEKTIQWIYDNFGGNVTCQKTPAGKPFYVWRMNQGKSLFYLLLLTLPFLVNKKEILADALIAIIEKFAQLEHTLGKHYKWGKTL